ncbi:MAG: hypothetical protein ACOY0T_11130 [Myxococcota bacterium]
MSAASPSSVPCLPSALLGGAAAGIFSALLNDSYFLLFRAATGFSHHEPSIGSITLSSLFPPLLAALGYFALTRLTRRADLVFALVTAAITIGSFAGVFQNTLPDGSLKPAGFDAAVMPMHLIVGLAALVFIPRVGRARTLCAEAA